ncbi:uncharacterized protein LOC115447045 [Manduca sexta]|uniref:Regulatory protein zeste n=2 Tax=Manduca sexta TaxID=7130 RepID=A0A922CQG9_MANSE|nr:uncharacterized protein LOC115447045 [Manduca sexta]KAG6455630.1 hypothetical protein O3G_MSEX009312 [Manduca sexta]
METKKHVFTATEKKIFTDIIKKFSGIIENKDTDGATLKLKNEAWDQVTEEYNASAHVVNKATHKQLRRLWMNLKQRQREALSKERQHRLTAGGAFASDAMDPDVAALAPVFIGVDASIDSDTHQGIHNSDTESDEQGSVKTEQVNFRVRSDFFEPQVSTGEHLIPQIAGTSNQSSFQTNMSVDCMEASILEKEYQYRQKRADEKHKLEMMVLREQYREAKAKADLAELVLKQRQSM